MRKVLVLLIIGTVVSACHKNSTEPTPTPTPTGPTVTSIALTGINGFTAAAQTSQLTATATLSNGTTQNVTSQATWASTNTGVATVSSAGVVTAAGGTGTATISATVTSAAAAPGVDGPQPASVASTLTVFSMPISATAATYVVNHVTAYGAVSRWTSFPVTIWADAGYQPPVSFSHLKTSWEFYLPGLVTITIVNDRASAQVKFDTDNTRFLTGSACGEVSVSTTARAFQTATVVTNTARADCSERTWTQALGYALGFRGNTPGGTDIMSSPDPQPSLSAPAKDAFTWIYAAPLGTTVFGAPAAAVPALASPGAIISRPVGSGR